MTKLLSYKHLPIVFFLVAYIMPLSWRPMIGPDEFRYAEIPRAMLDSGDYVSPRLLGVRYFEKPILGYQLTAASMAIFGENHFAIRLPAALAVAFMAWLIGYTVRRLRKNSMEAFWAQMLYLSFGLVFGVGTFAVLDSPTTAFVGGTLLFYLLAVNESERKKRWGFLTACGFCCGLAFLTKGFLAFAVPAVTIIPYLIWSKRFKAFWTTPWLPLLLVVVTALPWSLMIHFREPDFWHYFFWVEHIQRFFSDTSGQHPEPFWMLIPPFIGGVFPGALAAIGAFTGLKKYYKELLSNDFFKFMLCAVIFPFLFFSASSGKLATYILPCFPPLAVLLGCGLNRYLTSGGHKLQNAIFTGLGILLAVALPLFILYQFLPLPQLFMRVEWYKWAIPAVAVAFWAGLLLWSRRQAVFKRTMCFFIGLAPAMAFGMLAMPQLVLDGKAHEEPLRRLAHQVPANAILAAHPNVMHAVGWVFDRDDLYFYLSSGELEDSIEKTYPDEYGFRLLSYNRLDKLADKEAADVVVFVRLKPKYFDEDRARYLKHIAKTPKYEDYDGEIWMAAF